MFGLVYLSNENQKLLQKLEERLAKTQNRQLRNETQLAIQEIRNKAIPYTECDLIQAEELKSQLLQKLNTVIGLGKRASAEAFRIPLKDVEFHIQTLQMKEIMLEKEKMGQPDEPPTLEDKLITISEQKREQKRKKTFQGQRWLVGMEDEPDSDNK